MRCLFKPGSPYKTFCCYCYIIHNSFLFCIISSNYFLSELIKKLSIKIDNSKYYAFYAHLLQIDVKKGDIVKKGDTIGKTGITGNAKTFRGLDQHLHFECRTAAKLGKGLDGRLSPNNIVLTKFYSQDPKNEMQSSLGVYKVDKNNKQTKMDCIL